MTQAAAVVGIEAAELALISGDLAKLNPDQRVTFYNRVCESLGLNPLTQPFSYITLNGKLTLYARKDAADQLRRVHGVSIGKPDIRFEDDWILVTVTATTADGRSDSDVGAVSRKDMRGDFGNALMKAVTKAKRRVTLSVCGLGMLDETEVESIPGARAHAEFHQPALPPKEPAKPAPAANRNHTSDDLFDVIRQLADLEDRPTGEVIAELFRAMKTDAASLDDLNQKAVNDAHAAVVRRIEKARTADGKLPGTAAEPTDISALAK